jgi:hypothetical protein
MWLTMLNFALGLANNPMIKKLVMALVNQLLSGATSIVPEAITLMKEASANPEINGFDSLAYVAKQLKEKHPDMAMSAITNIVTSVYNSYEDEIKKCSEKS